MKCNSEDGRWKPQSGARRKVSIPHPSTHSLAQGRIGLRAASGFLGQHLGGRDMRTKSLADSLGPGLGWPLIGSGWPDRSEPSSCQGVSHAKPEYIPRQYSVLRDPVSCLQVHPGLASCTRAVGWGIPLQIGHVPPFPNHFNPEKQTQPDWLYPKTMKAGATMRSACATPRVLPRNIMTGWDDDRRSLLYEK